MDWRELESESTEDLIVYIRAKGDKDYSELAEAAFYAFVFRFRDNLLDKCIVICRKNGRDEHDAAEIANRTFERVLKYPKWSIEKCRISNADECMRLYLYRIANREFLSYISKAEEGAYNGDEEIIASFADVEGVERKAELKKAEEFVSQALRHLSEKHRIVYLTYIAHSKDGKYLPRHLTQKLRETLNLTQSSIRVYKREATEAIQNFLKNGKR